MEIKRTHCMRCGNQGVRSESNGREIYTCAAMGHGLIASYEIPAAEPEKAPEQEEQQPEPEKAPEPTEGDADHGEQNN